MSLHDALGPRWADKELRTFYILLKAHGKQWDKLGERLPGRSERMVQALFEKHRGYLSLPEASLEGFCAIMKDHYESQGRTESAGVTEGPKQGKTEQRRKKRRLDKLLEPEQLGKLRLQTEDVKMEDVERHKRARKSTPTRSRALSGGELAVLQGKRFDLPWTHWFYSYVDVDFFRHNEFIECLTGMGLGKITAAARPIWSSVRASMGRPRRLSPVFFAQEKAKLEMYRAAKRRNAHPQQPDGTWPYSCPTPLHPAAKVIVWVKEHGRFQLGVVAKVTPGSEFCHVVFENYIGDEACRLCSLDDVMILDFPPWTKTDKYASMEPKLAATTLLRRDSASRGDTLPPQPVDTTNGRYREEKLRAVIAVKGLLQRKEKLVSALAALNKRVSEQQQQLRRQNAMTSSLWTTPTAFSSQAVKDLVWSNSREKALVQQQHSWLMANLEATNSHLMAALLSLQSFSSASPSWSNALTTPDATGSVYPASSGATDTLSVDQMRWAIDFLSASQHKAASVVAASALVVMKDEGDPRGQDQAGVLPDTMQLVANCVTLMSVLHRRGGAAPDVPPVVTQTLVERLLELLKPTHDANMDLYAELRAAAESAQLQLATRPSHD